MTEPQLASPEPDPRRLLDTLVDEWVTVPQAAEIQGRSLSTVRGQLKDRELLSTRRGPNNAVYIPAMFVTAQGPLPTLRGTVIVLLDGGMSEDEALVWLFTPQAGLGGDGTPARALEAGRKTEIRRRAMETAF